MRKQKQKEQPSTPNYVNIVLGIGLIALLGISLYATFNWLFVDSKKAPQTTPTTASLAIKPGELKMPETGPAKLNLVYSTSTNAIADFTDDLGSRQTTLKGGDIAATANGKTISYIYQGKLHLFKDGGDYLIDVPNTPLMPAWNKDGTSLAFVSRSVSQDTIYQVSPETLKPIELLITTNVAASPLFDPLTGHLVIAKLDGTSRTTFVSIDPTCGSTLECAHGQKEIFSVPYAVTWASYQPSGSHIVFSESKRGDLYLVEAATGKIQELLPMDRTFKGHPIFSPEGTHVLFLDDKGAVYVLQLADMTTRQIRQLSDVLDIVWVNGEN